MAVVPLSTIAHGRSGDKGNHANIAVLAYTPAGYAWLRDHLPAQEVRDYFAALGPSNVERFEVENVLGLNFMLYDVLAGGASRSLRIDTQGKTLALALLQMMIDLPNDHAAKRPRAASSSPARGQVSARAWTSRNYPSRFSARQTRNTSGTMRSAWPRSTT